MSSIGNNRILVIDDNKSLVFIAERVLQREGYIVSTALNGQEGIHKAKTEKPDLIVLDIEMPGLNGYEVCRELQQDQNTINIPIIFLSAKGNTDETQGASAVGLKEIKLAFNLGASEFLHKPVSAADLITAVKKTLSFTDIISSERATQG